MIPRSLLHRSIPILLALLLAAGCSPKKEEQQILPPEQKGDAGVTRKETVVKVPQNVEGKWKAVKIAIQDKIANTENVVSIDIGSNYQIPGTTLSISVDTFLPHFVMEGATLTSQSNEPKNPAVQVRILDSGKELFKGWLFTLYPTTHAFKHPQYTFALVDFVPAVK
ncbi:MAG: DUF2155 domain-containing protein [Desulfuromonadia bacterium]